MTDHHSTVLASGFGFGDGPHWFDDRLWFADIFVRSAVLSVGLGGDVRTEASFPGRPTALGSLPDGTLLVSTMMDRQIWCLADREPTPYADLAAGWDDAGGTNGMHVDSRGRCYVSQFGYDRFAGAPPQTTSLILVTPDREVRAVASDLDFPTGIAVTPDGRTLVVLEAGSQRLTAFDVDDRGDLTGRRVFAQLDAPGDNICLDAAGAIWVACLFDRACIRVTEGGEITDRVHTTAISAVAPHLGGDDGRTMFVYSANLDLETYRSEEEALLNSQGFIETVRVDVPAAGR